MPKIRDILSHVAVEVARGKRTCHRNQVHSIGRGEVHLAIYDSASGGRKNYCRECSRPILARARDHLDELEAKLFT